MMVYGSFYTRTATKKDVKEQNAIVDELNQVIKVINKSMTKFNITYTYHSLAVKLLSHFYYNINTI